MVVLFTVDANSRIPNYKLSVHLEWFSNISSQCSRLETEKKHFPDENASQQLTFKQLCKYSYRTVIVYFVLSVKVYFKQAVSFIKMFF